MHYIRKNAAPSSPRIYTRCSVVPKARRAARRTGRQADGIPFLAKSVRLTVVSLCVKQTAESGFAVHDREVISIHNALTGCGASRYRMPLSVVFDQGAPLPMDGAFCGLGTGSGERGGDAPFVMHRSKEGRL